MRFRCVVLFVLSLIAIGCSTLTQDIKVATEADPTVNLKRFETYGWMGSAEILNDPQGQWEPLKFDADAEIRHLINTEMRRKGITEVSENPDLLVGFAAGIDMAALKLVENPETKMKTIKNVPGGALMVILVDPARRHPVWVGEAVGNVKTERTPEQARKRLKYAVSQMFAKMRR